MQVQVLASGSKGNSILVEMGNTRILVDAGISARRIERGLEQVGIKASELDALLITHEHSDHIKGVEVLARRHSLPVYTRPLTWEGLGCRNRLPLHLQKEISQEMSIGDIKVIPFNTSHDAADPVGYCFHFQEFKWVIATDLGMVTDGVRTALEDADLLILEANHDMQMLNDGPYPEFLKKRIRSNVGHLSNNEAAKVLASVSLKPQTNVFLAHLSQTNNSPHLAHNTVQEFLKQKGYNIGQDIILNHTFQDGISGLAQS